jgi:hypothetical protein
MITTSENQEPATRFTVSDKNAFRYYAAAQRAGRYTPLDCLVSDEHRPVAIFRTGGGRSDTVV